MFDMSIAEKPTTSQQEIKTSEELGNRAATIGQNLKMSLWAAGYITSDMPHHNGQLQHMLIEKSIVTI